MAIDLSPAAIARDSDVEFFNPGGPGGQHRNKTETGVRVRHRPTGLSATATERRQRSQNLSAAFERLRRKLVVATKPRPERVPTRPTRAAKRRRLDAKRRLAEKKRLRSRGDGD